MDACALTWLVAATLTFGVGCGPDPVAAQEKEGAPGDDVLARFGDAQALSVDPLGRFYVVDADEDVVVVLGADGTVQERLGGSGTRAGEFDTPSDVDPTNGHTLLVADTRNGRVQRFSAERQYLEAVPVGRTGREEGPGRTFDDGRDGAAVQGSGRPIAVASSSGDETFVIDERDAVVLKWDERRRPERIIGGMAQRTGGLWSPVALALEGSRRLYVADSEREAVLAYDPFGTFVRQLPTPSLPNVRALTQHRGRLWIVCAERLFAWDQAEEALSEYAVDRDEPLVDVARHGNALYLLTPTRLIRRATW